MKFPVRGEAGFLFLLMTKNFTHPVISLRGTDSLEVLNDTRALSKAAGHQRVVDRQTDSELHVKSPFPFKKKITLKHRRTRGSTHTRVSPPNKKIPSPHPPISLWWNTVSTWRHTRCYIHLSSNLLYFIFFSYSSNGSCSSITRHVFASLELVGVFGDRLMTARLSGSNESHCSFTRTDT